MCTFLSIFIFKWIYTVCVYCKVHFFNMHLYISPLLCCGNSPGDGGVWLAVSSSSGSVGHGVARKWQWFWPPTCVSVGASRQCEYYSTSSRPECAQQPPCGHPHPCSAAQAVSSAPGPPLCSPEQRGGTHACPTAAPCSVPGPQVDRRTPMHEAQQTGIAAAPAATVPLAKCSNLDSSAP